MPGAARLRLFSLKQDWAVSGWSYGESLEHVVLGRPLDEHERRRMLAGMVLN